MHVIHAMNVCEALPVGVEYLLQEGMREESRAGSVIVAPEPVTTVYDFPNERVLFSAVRDANPFFHLAEAMWMIAGRNDAVFLNRFVKDFGDRFAESDGKIHGAYGHRWRHTLGFDQIDHVIKTLKSDPTSRQCVLQMWDASLCGENDLRGSWKDRPCNSVIYLRVHEGLLDMTVCCRSNDIIWGAYGANAVHFSILHEYLAAKIGVTAHRYYQISNNYHLYEAELDRLCGRANVQRGGRVAAALTDNRYAEDGCDTLPIVTDPEAFDVELKALLSDYEKDVVYLDVGYNNAFLGETVGRALMAHSFWRNKYPGLALDTAEQIEAPDWRAACCEWLERRISK